MALPGCSKRMINDDRIDSLPWSHTYIDSDAIE